MLRPVDRVAAHRGSCVHVEDRGSSAACACTQKEAERRPSTNTGRGYGRQSGARTVEYAPQARCRMSALAAEQEATFRYPRISRSLSHLHCMRRASWHPAAPRRHIFCITPRRRREIVFFIGGHLIVSRQRPFSRYPFLSAGNVTRDRRSLRRRASDVPCATCPSRAACNACIRRKNAYGEIVLGAPEPAALPSAGNPRSAPTSS